MRGRLIFKGSFPPFGSFSSAVNGNMVRLSSSLSPVNSSLTTTNQSEARPYNEIPGPGGIYRWPIIGTLLNFKPFTEFSPEATHLLLKYMYEEYGPLFRLQLGKDTVVVTTPEDIQTVYRNEGKYPSRPNLELREVYARRCGIKSMDVATLQGEKWHSLRTPLNKRLVKVDSAAYYLQPQTIVAQDFARILANQELSPDALSELFFRYASESIGVVCFNIRLGLLDEKAKQDPKSVAFLEAAKQAFKMLHRSFTGESIAHSLYRNETYRNFEQAAKTLYSYSREHILKAKEVVDTQVREGVFDPTEPNLLLSLVSDKSLEDDHVTQILESLYSGGTDSTAGSLQALFYNLAKNPDKQEKLFEEIKSIIGSDQPVTMDALNRMHYLKACMKESFRLLYPVSGVVRILPKDVVLSGYKVPSGVQILLDNYLTCQNEFVDPSKYIPERWMRSSEGRYQKDLPKTAVLPFGYGPRNCIGRRFAEQELYLATIMVLQKLKISVQPESRNTPFVYRIFLQPAEPIKFTFTMRE